MPAQSDGKLTMREKVALGVMIFCGSGIVVTVVSAVWAGTYASSLDNRYLVLTIVSALIPMFGAGAGVAIAFYLLHENNPVATNATWELMRRLGDDRLRAISTGDVGTPVIEAISVAAGQEATIPFADVKAKLIGRVSRIPVWDTNRVVRYVIHESMIYKYWAEKPTFPPDPTLSDFLSFAVQGRAMRTIVSAIAWIPPDGTLAVARERMASVPDCQDVFVTADGQATQPVLQWITNADIAKAKL
ncbi:hypothetical protein [Bradyrhizobium japonicum]|nr:hypothetical protein [Bradyrhizobium japonicum]